MWIVYKTTNCVNGRFYIGVHRCENSEDGYLGSGDALRAAIKKYGKENFIRETLYQGEEEDSLLIESILVDERMLSNPLCYNITLGGGKPPSPKGKPKSEATKRKMAESAKRSWAKGTRIQHLQSEEFKQRMRLNNPKKGTKESEETRAKKSSSLKGNQNWKHRKTNRNQYSVKT